MSSTAIIAQGITIARMGTTAFETIPNVVSFQGPGGQAQVIDVTNLSSTAKEKRMGLRDEGSLSLTLHFDPDNAVHDGLNRYRFSRRFAASRKTAAQIVLATSSRYSRGGASGCRTFRCNRRHPAVPLRVLDRSCV